MPPKKALYVTAKDRARDYPKQLYEDGGKLFCRLCSCVLDHTRKSTIDDHVKKNKKHLNRLRDDEEADDTPAAKRQRTL